MASGLHLFSAPQGSTNSLPSLHAQVKLTLAEAMLLAGNYEASPLQENELQSFLQPYEQF